MGRDSCNQNGGRCIRFRVQTKPPCFNLKLLVKERFEHIAKELSTGKYDVVALQEVWNKSDYAVMCDKLSSTLPYSLYFYSGVIGSGMCVFSRYRITNSFTYRFSLNGYLYKLWHGDWLAGTSAGYCVIDHPIKPIHFFVSHLHAEYNRQDDEYLAHRVTQAYQFAQLIELITKPSDCVIVCGDMNSEPTDLCYRILCNLPGLTDTWLECNKEGYHGNTYGVSHNSFAGSTFQQAIQKGPSDGIRIDYIFYRGDRSNMELLDCHVTMSRIPGEEISYSDHEGVLATFCLKNDKVLEKGQEKVQQIESKCPTETNQDKFRETLKEVSSMMSVKLSTTPYHRHATALITALLMFIILPIFLPEGNLLLYSMGTCLGVGLYIARILCSMLVTALVFYVFLNDRDEYHAYKDVYEAVNIRLVSL
ncbi:putative neutral sphingomyelinase isoform X2 [Nematostella vectensis]|uniref:putative neutral sphingomyelinase isoform X2 n=1 Tax=Nematostella vectensis TaxID=45351 RepID=UPI002077393C|nr:putative neutral sphingomyelinase isoform X2 [Nematostella vectensis]